jgi:hypothetical protein
MITKFITKHNITIYRLSKLTGVSQQTLHLWVKKGPPNPVFTAMALAELGRKLETKSN